MRQLPLALALIATVIAVALGRTRWAAPSLCTARVAYGILVLQAPLYFMVASDFGSHCLCASGRSVGLSRNIR